MLRESQFTEFTDFQENTLINSRKTVDKEQIKNVRKILSTEQRIIADLLRFFTELNVYAQDPVSTICLNYLMGREQNMSAAHSIDDLEEGNNQNAYKIAAGKKNIDRMLLIVRLVGVTAIAIGIISVGALLAIAAYMGITFVQADGNNQSNDQLSPSITPSVSLSSSFSSSASKSLSPFPPPPFSTSPLPSTSSVSWPKNLFCLIFETNESEGFFRQLYSAGEYECVRGPRDLEPIVCETDFPDNGQQCIRFTGEPIDMSQGFHVYDENHDIKTYAELTGTVQGFKVVNPDEYKGYLTDYQPGQSQTLFANVKDYHNAQQQKSLLLPTLILNMMSFFYELGKSNQNSPEPFIFLTAVLALGYFIFNLAMRFGTVSNDREAKIIDIEAGKHSPGLSR